MCGIVAVIGKVGLKEEKVFKQLLEVDSLRGRHSTGVIKVEYDGAVSTRKKAVDGMDFVKLEDKFISMGTNKVLIGHNRWATKGAVNDVNAHPFTHGHIHGVHNGTLTQQYKLKDSQKFPVDSDNIFYNIMHEGVEATVEKLFGAFAIVMYDEKEKAVSVFRNSERELGMAILNNGETVILASEYLMLEWVLRRNDYDPAKYKIVELLDTFKHVKFKPFEQGSVTKNMEVSELKKPVYTAPKVVGGNAVGGNFPTLASKNLNGVTYYPLEYDGIRKESGTQDRATFRLMCPPFGYVNMNIYNPSQKKLVEELVKSSKHGMIAGKVSVPYSANNVDEGIELVTYSVDIRRASDSDLSKVDYEGADKAFEKIDEEMFDDYVDGDNVVPFS